MQLGDDAKPVKLAGSGAPPRKLLMSFASALLVYARIRKLYPLGNWGRYYARLEPTAIAGTYAAFAEAAIIDLHDPERLAGFGERSLRDAVQDR